MSMSSASQLESSLISVAGSDSTLASSSKFTTIGVPIGKLVIGVGAGGGGGWGLFEGRLLFEEIW